MPVPKGVNPKKFDDCIEQVKRKQGGKVNAYAVCNSSLKKNEGKKCMSTKPEIKKALSAGYSEGGTAPEKLEEVHTGPALTPVKPEEKVSTEAVAATPPVAETKVEAKVETPPPAADAAKPVIPANLFKPFTLGAKLAQNPNGGNVMTGMKKPAMDYVEVEKKATKNVRMTAEDFKPKK